MKRLLMLGSMILAATLFIHADVSTAALKTATVSDYTVGMAAGGIGFSRHNLGGFGRVLRTGSTTEICIFCHTPHHASTDMTPLWNRGTPVSSFTAYGDTIGGSNIASVGGPSLACLSCHDGVTTFDNIVNRPGKDVKGSSVYWGFNMPAGNIFPAADNAMLDAFHTGDGQVCSLCHNAGSNVTLETLRSMVIGTDLSNDHPVSVAYAGGSKASLRAANTVISTIDLKGDLLSSAATAFDSNLSQNRWAVAGFISDTATISDLLRDGNVECSSCHDPHFSNKSWDEVDATWVLPVFANWCTTNEDCSDGLFLRRVGGNTGSGLCRTCHEK
ncbi:MAG: hypothetical protein IME99_05850 [Proteobacteria bacterium]|nr:hypothetical protein [Pseudomonadota bacterium]